MTPSGTLRHLTLVASDLTASLAFYDAVLAPLGLTRASEFPDEEEPDGEVEAVGYASDSGEAVLWLVAGPLATRGVHVAFDAAGPAEVTSFYEAAIANGGTGRQRPHRWAIYRPGYFGALVADPDGNLIEAVTFEG